MAHVIFHVDLDAFYVAVERSRDPSLNGKPVIVGGLGNRGVVSTASYEARKYGVHSAMPMATARRLCPQAIYLSGDFSLYGQVSRRVMAILERFSPVVEVASVDEAYIDMTGTERLFGPPPEAASLIRRSIRSEAGVTASIGVGSNRLVAKVATERAKPDGVHIVPAGQEAAFLAPLPVRALPGVGPRAADALQSLGIKTLGQLAAAPEGPLRRALGLTSAAWLKRRAAGYDATPVEPRHEAKSISAETTFDHDITDRARLNEVARELSERVGRRLRRANRRAGNVGIKLRYSDFTTITRQRTLQRPSDGDEAIIAAATELLARALRERLDPVRLLGVAAGNLRDREGQLSLLDEGQDDDSAISSAMDAIRERFGSTAVRRGGADSG